MLRNLVTGPAIVAALALMFGVSSEEVARATHPAMDAPGLAGQKAGDFQWRGPVPGGTIEIKGINGNVTATRATGSEAEVTAERTARRNNPDEVKLEVVEHAGGVTICAVYPSKEGAAPNQCMPGNKGRMNVQNNDVTVHFTVRVPAGVRFAGRTVNGNVDAQGLDGAVALTTVNGSATFSTSSYGTATTVNGSIRGAMGSAGWDDALEFKTVNGSISLDLPADLSTDVHATTVNGEITTDFAVAINGLISRRRMNGTIGSGGRQLDLETVNGSVRLRRQ